MLPRGRRSVFPTTAREVVEEHWMDLLKRAIIPIAALIITLIAVGSAFFDPRWLWVLIVSLPVVALGLFDYFQRSWVITRNYPVAGRLRWVFYMLRPYLRP